MFKNVIAFRLDEFSLSAEDLEEKLKGSAKKPLGAQEISRMGFSAPFSKHSDMLVHSANGCYLMCISKEEKVLPGAVIKEMLEEKIEAIENEQDRKVRGKEKKELKEQIIFELLPQAFSKTSKTFGYFDTTNNLLVVDAGSAKKAEDFASFIRKAIGSLKVRLMDVSTSPAFIMTSWLKETTDLPDALSLGGEASLADPSEDAGKITAKNVDLVSEEIQSHLDQGMMVKTVSVSFEDKMSFVVNDELHLKRIKFGETFNEQVDDVDADDAMARMDASFTIASSFIAEAVTEVLNAFGGETSPE